MNELECQTTTKKKMPFIIVCILLIGIFLVGGISFYLHQKSKNPENVYYQAIDNFKDYLIENIDNTNKKYNKPVSLKGNITLDLQTKDNELNKIYNILNNVTINYDNEINILNNVANSKLELNYKGEKVADINSLLKNSDAYIALENIYDRPIKIADSNFSPIWNAIDLNNLRTIINELSKIIKNNLKKEYFTIESENDITSYILNINKDNLNSYRNNLMESIKYNNNLLMAIASISNRSTDEVKKLIDSKKQDLEPVQDDLKITTKINKDNKVTNVIIVYGDTYVIDYLKENTYEISTLYNGNKVKLGKMEIKKDYFQIECEKDNEKINGTIANEDNSLIFDIKISSKDGNYHISNNISDNKGSLIVDLSKEDDNIKVTINYEMNNIEKVNELDISNYIESSMIKEEDGNTIISNLMNNNGTKTLVSDLITTNLGSLIFGNFGSGTEEANI